MFTETEKAYIAGILELAYWSIEKQIREDRGGKTYHRLHLTFSYARNPNVLKHLSTLLGGQFIDRQLKKENEVLFVKKNHQRLVNLSENYVVVKFTTNGIKKIIQEIEPYLIVKKPQLLIFKQFIKTLIQKKRVEISSEILFKREELYEKISLLNKI